MELHKRASGQGRVGKTLIFPCYKKIGEQFGLLSYGCCEPVDPIWDNCISKFENLRKVSVSPWCNEEFMGERLQGSKVIFHRKPSTNFLGVNSVLNEEALRAHIRKSLHAARGCKMEITQRDVYTIHNDIAKAGFVYRSLLFCYSTNGRLLDSGA